MVRATKVQVVAVVCAGLLFGSWLAGCSDKPSRAAGNVLLEQSRLARDRTAKALMIMGNPAAAKLAQIKAAPTSRVAGEANTPLVMTVEDPNPEALALLDQAEGELSRAIAAAGAAESSAKAIAMQQLGAIDRAKAMYFGIQARSAQGRLMHKLNESRQVSDVLDYCLGLLAYYSGPGAAGAASQPGAVTPAGGAASKAKLAQVDANKKEQEQIKAKLKGLNEQRLKLQKESADLRAESNKYTGNQAYDTFERGAKQQSLANAMAKDIVQLESKLELLDAQAKSLQAQADLDIAMEKIDQDVAKAAADKAAEAARKKEIVQNALGEMQKRMDKLVGECAPDIEKARDGEKKAAAALNAAAKALDDALAIDPANHGVAADRADVAMAQADADAQRLYLYSQLERPAQELKQLWARLGQSSETIERFAKLPPAYLEDAAAVRQEALKNYQEAARLYSQAMNQVRPELQWVYKGHLACAYVGAFRASKDRSWLIKADEAVKDALENKENSPFLADVAQTGKYVQELMDTNQQ